MRLFGYTRISFDEELESDENSSIEAQKQIIKDYTAKNFPNQEVTFYTDRSVSGFSFAKRNQYNAMRAQLRKGDILLVKDYSRFSRNDIEATQEMQALSDAGIELISISDGIIDTSSYNGWLLMKLKSIFNEMPVRETSSKVRQVVTSRQKNGNWICAVPYGYRITNTKEMTYEVDPSAAEVVREVFNLYCDGWGYKKICNYLTEKGVPTPTQNEIAFAESQGRISKKRSSGEWAIPTVQKMLENDFYIGTLRQHKYRRNGVNGKDKRIDVEDQIAIEHSHEPIIDNRTWAFAQECKRQRSAINYRGEKKYPTDYSGYLYCGTCGKPMFSRSSPRLTPSYICGTYQRRGLAGCTAHTVSVPELDSVLKSYITQVMENSQSIIDDLNSAINNQPKREEQLSDVITLLTKQRDDEKEKLKGILKRKVIETLGKDETAAGIINEAYEELEAETTHRINVLEKQIEDNIDSRNRLVKANRAAKTVLDVFQSILDKPKLDKRDIGLIVDRITIYDDYKDIHLKADVDELFHLSDHCFHVLSNGDPLEIYTSKEGEVIFKKYSLLGGVDEFASQLCEMLSKSTGASVAITDRDSIIAAAGSARRELIGKHISTQLEQIMEDRGIYRACLDERSVYVTDSQDRFCALIAAPIISEGDALGLVLFVGAEGEFPVGETEYKLAQTISGFLGKQMES